MNILSRSMFANGGPAQQEPSIPELIGYYVSQGYNALEIKEMLPDLAMGDIEAAVSQLGGSINSAVASPGANEFEGNFNVLPQIPETTVTANQDGMTTMNPSFPERATPPELPSLDDISIVPPELQQVLAATAQFGKDQQLMILTSPNYSFNLSEEEARQILNMPSADIDMIDPEMPSDLPVVEEVGNIASTLNKASDLGPNQYRTSKGIVHTIDPTKFAEDLNQENDRILSGILSNPNAEYGSNLASIVESAALKRSSSLVPEEDIRVGQNIMLNPSSEMQTAGKYAVDLFKDAGEGFANAFRSVISPEMVGIFRGRGAEEAARLAGRGEDLDLFSTPDSFNPMDYGSTGGERPETLDQIVLSSSLGEDITKSLEDIAAEETKNVEQKEDEVVSAATKEETATEDETETDEEGNIVGASTDPKNTGAVVDGDKKDKDEPSDDFKEEERNLISMIGTAFNSDANLRMMRNVGKALTQYGNFAEGIGKGSAAAAEEKALRDLEDEALKKELLLKGFEGQTLDYKEANAIKDNNKELAANIRSFQKNQKNVTEIDKVLDIIDQTQGRAFGVVGAIAKLTTAAAIAAGSKVTNWDNLDPRTKIDAITKVLQQSNIQEILGESGRTISNLDREVIKDVFGSMTIFTSEAEIVKKLEDSRAKTLTASNQTRGEIAAGKNYFDITGRESVVISKNKDLIDLILAFDPDDFVSKGERKVVDVDYRKEFNR